MTRFVLIIFTSALLASCASRQVEQNEKVKADLHMQIAISYMNSGRYPQALTELLQAEEIDPQDAVVQSNLGYVYYMRESYELAENHFKKAISLKPNFSDAKNSLARVYIETGDYKKAESLLKEVLNDLTYVDYTKAYINYALLQFKRKNYSLAADYFKKVLEKDRENCLAQVYLGRCYMESGDLGLAVPQLEKAVPFCRRTGSDEAHFYSAIALYRNHQIELAKYRFEEMLKLFPSGNNYDKGQKMLELIKKEAP